MNQARICLGRQMLLGSAAAALAVSACASHTVKSGAAVASAGRGLSSYARDVPQGARACALEAALASATPGTAEKPLSESCQKAANSDLLWRRALVVLSAYSARLEAIANGESPETAGRLEATETGVLGEDWIDAEPGQEQAARAAVAKLVSQMLATGEKTDFDKVVKDAAPEVKTICDGLGSYLGTQATRFGDIAKEIEKRRAAKQDRRCAAVDSRTICVSESVIDRIVYADAFGEIFSEQQNHQSAHDDVASFCAAHAKLGSAAESGDTNKDETYTGIVDAVKAVPRAQPARVAPAEKAPEKK